MNRCTTWARTLAALAPVAVAGPGRGNITIRINNSPVSLIGSTDSTNLVRLSDGVHIPFVTCSGLPAQSGCSSPLPPQNSTGGGGQTGGGFVDGGVLVGEVYVRIVAGITDTPLGSRVTVTVTGHAGWTAGYSGNLSAILGSVGTPRVELTVAGSSLLRFQETYAGNIPHSPTQRFIVQNTSNVEVSGCLIPAGTYRLDIPDFSVHAAPDTIINGTYTFSVGCRADFDMNGSIQPSDVAAFIAAWFSDLSGGTRCGDMDQNGVVQPADIAAFVGAWFGALSGSC